MRKERLIKSTMLGLGVVGAMLINMTNAMSSYIHEQYDEENGVNTLTICDWYDSSKCITMKDRNEGATEAGTGCRKPNFYCSVYRQNYGSYDSCIESNSMPLYQAWGYGDVESCEEWNGENCGLPYYHYQGYESAEGMCGTGNFQGFSTYEECESERILLIEEYDECVNNNKGVYGYHFQRGNNYGFDPFTELTTGDIQVDCTNIGPSTHNSSTFIGGFADWCSSSNDNLWGGSGDSQSNNRGLDSENPITDRQGPCREGYHVPSLGEWNQVLKYRSEENNVSLNNYGTLTSSSINRIKFNEDFKVPLAGQRYNNADVNGIGGNAYLWSSTPNVGTEIARNFYSLLSDYYGTSAYGRAYALSVRCFKNSALSFSSSNTVRVKVIVDGNILYEGEITAGSKFSDSADLMAILNQDMSKSGWRFLGWYDKNGEDKINFNTVPTTNTKIVAKYTNVFEKKVNGINTITICDQNGKNCITMKDRNEGATKAGTGCSSIDTGACGLHFQRGNNYGFDPFTEPTIGDIQVDCTNIGPSTHNSSTFIGGFADWCSSSNDNLWGGSGDSQDNNRGLDSENPLTDRQGPCDTGYHIPSIGEWSKVLEYRAEKNNVFLSNSEGLKFSWGLGSLKFQNDFKIPFAGSRDINAYVNGITLNTMLWSSSPNLDTVQSRFFVFAGSSVAFADNSEPRADALSIRCFKDEPLSLPSSVVFKIIDSDEEKNSRVVETQDVLPSDVIERMSEYANSNPGYTLSGWYDDEAESRWTPEMEVETGFTLRAVWKENKTSSSNGSHGGGGSTISKDNCPNGDFSDSYYDGTCGTKPQNNKEVSSGVNEEVVESSEEISSSEGQGNNELQTAYEFAYKNGITTMDTMEEADMEGDLTRIAMAKMLSKYAINVLGKKPTNTVVPQFSDVTEELNAEYDNGVSLAYQLGIMGINMPDNKFRPFDLVTRAEFVTALSRLLYDTEDGEKLYYSTHMELLNKMGIITVTDPDMKELRGYVMLMLMRSTNN